MELESWMCGWLLLRKLRPEGQKWATCPHLGPHRQVGLRTKARDMWRSMLLLYPQCRGGCRVGVRASDSATWPGPPPRGLNRRLPYQSHFL